MSKLRELAVQILVHGVKPFLQLFLRQFTDGIVCRVVIHVRKENCLRKGRLDVFARTTVAVSTCTNLGEMSNCRNKCEKKPYFVVEGTVNAILLCAEDICLNRI